jgi:hypothetical protein
MIFAGQGDIVKVDKRWEERIFLIFFFLGFWRHRSESTYNSNKNVSGNGCGFGLLVESKRGKGKDFWCVDKMRNGRMRRKHYF